MPTINELCCASGVIVMELSTQASAIINVKCFKSSIRGIVVESKIVSGKSEYGNKVCFIIYSHHLLNRHDGRKFDEYPVKSRNVDSTYRERDTFHTSNGKTSVTHIAGSAKYLVTIHG